MKINKTFPILLALPLFLLNSCGKSWNDGEFKTFDKTVEIKPESVKLEATNFHTAAQSAYINSTWDTISSFADGKKELSRPRGIKLNVETASTKNVQVSLTEDFKENKVYTFEANQEPVLHNLLSNKTYYYKTSETLDFANSTISSFTTTNELPRNLYVSGVTNVRDIGGYESKLGGTIKQNMYFRGGRLTVGKYSPEAVIKPDGYKVLTEDIGIKTEIDLRRNEDVNFDPENGHMNNEFFPEIEYKTIPMETRNIENLMVWKDEIKQVFDVLSEEKNYPVYLHCTIGTDRTGMVSFLLGALLGMNIEDLVRDYLFSNFGFIHGSRTSQDPEKYFNTLKAYNKETLQLCAEAFLLECGNTQEQLEAIKSILIEK